MLLILDRPDAMFFLSKLLSSEASVECYGHGGNCAPSNAKEHGDKPVLVVHRKDVYVK